MVGVNQAHEVTATPFCIRESDTFLSHAFSLHVHHCLHGHQVNMLLYKVVRMGKTALHLPYPIALLPFSSPAPSSLAPPWLSSN